MFEYVCGECESRFELLIRIPEYRCPDCLQWAAILEGELASC